MATYKELPEQWKGSIPTSVEQSGQSTHYQSSNAVSSTGSSGDMSHVEVVVPTICIAMIIGPKGASIMEAQKRTGCEIIIDKNVAGGAERVITVVGKVDATKLAIEFISQRVEDCKRRDPNGRSIPSARVRSTRSVGPSGPSPTYLAPSQAPITGPYPTGGSASAGNQSYSSAYTAPPHAPSSVATSLAPYGSTSTSHSSASTPYGSPGLVSSYGSPYVAPTVSSAPSVSGSALNYSTAQANGQQYGYTSGQALQQQGYPAYSSGQQSSQGYPSGQLTSQGYPSGQLTSQGYSSGQQSSQGYPSGQQTAQGYTSGQQTAQAYTSGQQIAQGYTSGQQTSQGYPSGQQTAQGYPSGQQTAQGYTSGQQTSQGYTSGQQTSHYGYSTGQQQSGTAYPTGQSSTPAYPTGQQPYSGGPASQRGYQVTLQTYGAYKP
eukprot:gene242-250_t